MSEVLIARLESVLEPEATRQGFELVAVELAGGQGSPILRVYLDRDGGIDLDAVCSANQWVTTLLDQTDPFNGPYTLEVSSPGIDRPLRKLADYVRFTGSDVSMKTRPIAGVSRHTGRITGVEDETIVLDSDGTSVHVPYADVLSARLKGEVDFGQGKGGGQR